MKPAILRCYALLHHIATLKFPEFNDLCITTDYDTDYDNEEIRFKVMSTSDDSTMDIQITTYLSNYLALENIPHIRYRERGLEFNKKIGYNEMIALADRFSEIQLTPYFSIYND